MKNHDFAKTGDHHRPWSTLIFFNEFFWDTGLNHINLDISKPIVTGGYWKQLSGFWAGNQNVIEMPENSVSSFSASTPRRLKYHLDGSNLTVSTSHIPTIRGRSRAASGPRQGAKNIRKSSETVSPTKIFDFQDFLVMQFLRAGTDLEWKKSRV